MNSTIKAIRAPRMASVLFIILVPLLASAQTLTNAQSLFSFFLGILNLYVVPIIFAIAFVMFLFGVYRYFIAGGANAEKVQEGQKFVMWSVVGFVLMFSIWGIINLFINTLGFDSTSRPGLPTFGSSSVTSGTSLYPSTGNSNPSSIGSFISDIFGGGSSPVTSTTYTDPSTGTTYPVTGTNTVAQVNGNCPANYSPSGTSSCLNNAVTGSGTVQANGACTKDGDCQGDLACNVSSHTCQVDPNLEGGGYGTGNGTVTNGGTCKTNDDCAGNLACSDNNVCIADGDLEGPGYGDGDGNVGQGGACLDGNDCSGNLTCTNGICAVDSTLDAGNGSQGAACTNDNQCNGNMQCQDSMCEPDNGLQQQSGQCTQDSDCQGNLACISGSCQVDPNLESQDNYVDPNPPTNPADSGADTNTDTGDGSGG